MTCRTLGAVPVGAAFERALALATRAHTGQVDKVGQPYIQHPQRVAAQFADEALRVIAILHDVVEDTSVTLEEIAAAFGPEIAADVDALTRRAGEAYMDFVRRAAQRPRARQVKLADLGDNLDLSRLPRITDQDKERLARYRQALAFLEGVTP